MPYFQGVSPRCLTFRGFHGINRISLSLSLALSLPLSNKLTDWFQLWTLNLSRNENKKWRKQKNRSGSNRFQFTVTVIKQTFLWKSACLRLVHVSCLFIAQWFFTCLWMLGCLWILFLFVCECMDVYGSFVFVVFVSAWLFMGVFFLPPSVCVCVCVKIHVDYNINCYSVSNILNVCVFSTCME